MLDTAKLPDDIAALKAMLVAAEERNHRKDERIAQLEELVAAFTQAAFGRRSERSDPTSSSWLWSIWKRPSRSSMPRRTPRTDWPGGRPSRAAPILVRSQALAVDRGDRQARKPGLWLRRRSAPHWRGHLRATRRDPGPVPGDRDRRSKYACRSCTDGVVRAPAPARLIPDGLPSEARSPRSGQQVRRPPATLSSGADLQQPGR